MSQAKAILIDTGPLVALLNRGDSQHQRCGAVARELRGPVWTCLPVLTEACYLLGKVGGSSLQQRLGALFLNGTFGLLDLYPEDVASAFAIMKKYEDQSFDFADACLLQLCEREAITSVFTIDRKDFFVYRSRSGESLQLLPLE